MISRVRTTNHGKRIATLLMRNNAQYIAQCIGQ